MYHSYLATQLLKDTLVAQFFSWVLFTTLNYIFYLFANLLIFSVPGEVRGLMVPVHGCAYSTQNSRCIRAAWSDWHWLDVTGAVRWGVAARGAVLTQSELDHLPGKLLLSWAILGRKQKWVHGLESCLFAPFRQMSPIAEEEDSLL